MHEALLSWQTTERKIRNRTPDWYWVLGIIAVALSVASVLFGNVLFGIVIITGAIALGFATTGVKERYTTALTNRGVLIDTTLYPYENITSFCILEYENDHPVLSIRTNSIFAPQLSIPIIDADPYEVYEILEHFLQEDLHEENLFDRLVDFLGF